MFCKLMAGVLVTLLMGCANLTSIWRNEDGAGKVLGMDAQQRVVISAKAITQTNKGESSVTTTDHKYCPEPSPDAIASFAAAFAAGLTSGDKKAEVQAALSTSVASIAVRTPTIQVLRDLLMAACLGDMNGSFESAHFREAFARNQQFVLAAHAIAVIGGDVVVNPASTSGDASNAAGVGAAAMYDKYAKAAANRKDKQDERDVAQKEFDGAEVKATDAKKLLEDAKQAGKVTDEETTFKKAEADKTAKKALLDTEEKALKDLLALEGAAKAAAEATSKASASSASGKASPGSVANGGRTSLSTDSVVAIKEISTQVISAGFTLDKCINALDAAHEDINRAKEPHKAEVAKRRFDAVEKLCNKNLDEKAANARAQMINAEANKLEAEVKEKRLAFEKTNAENLSLQNSLNREKIEEEKRLKMANETAKAAAKAKTEPKNIQKPAPLIEPKPKN